MRQELTLSRPEINPLDASVPTTLNGLHARVQEGLEAAIHAGNILIHIKEALPHGEFEQWIRRNCHFSLRTARNYMKAAAQRETARVADLHATDLSEVIPATLYLGDFRRIELPPASFDWVITDPPYAKEYLPLYSDLSRRAELWLKPGGSLLVMSGQSYLPEVVTALGVSLSYQWTLTYLTPGGQSAQLWERHVNTFWKPVLWYVKGNYEGPWIGDVCKSAVNDNDKNHHQWGQSESGFHDLMKRFCKPAERVLDPMMGAGTTGGVSKGWGSPGLCLA